MEVIVPGIDGERTTKKTETANYDVFFVEATNEETFLEHKTDMC